MAHSYTPGLKVLKNTEIFKERRLPLKGQVDSKVGDVVEPGDIVAKTNLPGNVQMINVANQLNIDASDIKDYMIKDKGEPIKKGNLMAETKGLFGFFKSSVYSPSNGTIESISNVTGQGLEYFRKHLFSLNSLINWNERKNKDTIVWIDNIYLVHEEE